MNGWGLDEQPFCFLDSESHDVFMLYDYRDLSFPVDVKALFRPYKEIYLLAWSLGVWVSQSLKNLLPDRTAFSVAINGTLQPIHQQYGIAPDIFASTLQHLSPAPQIRLHSQTEPLVAGQTTVPVNLFEYLQ